MIKAYAHRFMSVVHVEVKACQHSNLKQEVQPGLSNEQTDVQHNGTRVKRKDVGVFHQGLACGTELVAQALRNVVSEFFPHQGIDDRYRAV